MKRLILLIVTWQRPRPGSFAALPSTGPRGGRTGKAVEYATVVLLKGTEQVAGMATDAEGRFALQAAPGEYTLLIQYLGFDPVKSRWVVEQENHLGDFVMRSSATGIESVEVKASGWCAARPTASWSTWPTPRRPSARTASNCWNAPRRMDRRRENINQRQERLEGLRQRPRTAHGAGTAADLPALAARRGDPENRGRTDDGRRLRCRLGGRHHPHHAQKTPRERRQRLGGVQHDAGRDRTQVQSVGQHQPAFGPRGLLRLGMGIFRKGHDHHWRADAPPGRGQGAERHIRR